VFDPQVRKIEKNKKSQKRQDLEYYRHELASKNRARRLSRAAFNYLNHPNQMLQNRNKRRKAEKERKGTNTFESLYRSINKKFHDDLIECEECEQLFYPYSGAKRRQFDNKFICHLCFSYLNKKDAKSDFERIPPLSLRNNLQMNDIPVELEGLNDLELRLLAPRQVFIWMHPKPVSGEMYARGNLVLVPANPQKSIHSLRSKLTVPWSVGQSLGSFND
jgi:hypothetical protein